MDHSIAVAAICQWHGHVTASVVQIMDTFNTASYWHQLAIHKIADWTKLDVLILLFF